MDFFDRWSLYRLSQWISCRVQTVQRIAPKKLGSAFVLPFFRRRKRLSGVGFLAMSVLGGVWANSFTQQEAILNWHRSHLPPLKFFEGVIEGYGFHSLEKLSRSDIEREKPRKTLKKDSRREKLRLLQNILDDYPFENQGPPPIQSDEKGILWASSDLKWIAIHQDPSEAISLHVYCQVCQEKPQSWRYLGLGWAGFSDLLQELESQGSAKQSSAPIPNRIGADKKIDSREITY